MVRHLARYRSGMKGKRVADVADPRESHPVLEPGEYRKVHKYPPDDQTVWEARTPNGLTGNLRAHTVEEHEDGTITVSPSILVNRPRGDEPDETWHGYLERGVWRQV